jgi:hypothetical protein
MQFEPGSGAHFESMNDPQQTDATVQVATLTQPGQPLGFKLSGTGTLASNEGGGGSEGGSAGGAMGGQGSDSRPGGGLGPPIDAPDPLQKYRWWIIGGFAAALAVGAVYVASRQRATVGRVADSGIGVDFDVPEPAQPVLPRVSRPAPAPAPRVPAARPVAAASSPAAPGPSMLLEALKEELFQLEVEHKQGKISQQEYEKTKAALDGTLERAIKRGAQT